MPAETQQEPTGFFRVVNDTLGLISKGAESYHDVQASRGENIVTAAPAAPSTPQAPAGTASPEIAIAARESKVAVPGGISTQTMILIGVGVVGAVALVAILARRK